MKRKREAKARSRLVLAALLAIPLLLHAQNAPAVSLEGAAGSITFSKKVKTLTEVRFRNMVRQTRDYSCGAAALATILTYHYGKAISEDEIMTYILAKSDPETVQKVKEKGVSLLDLKNFAGSLGYKGAGYKVSGSQLKRLDRPAIALINHNGYSHFVVLKGVADKEVFLADPAKGNTVMGLEAFLKMWNGILLVFKGPNGPAEGPRALYVKSNGLHKSGLLTNQLNLGFVVSPSEFKY
ncbi:MAG TPA: C39 family peptidase [Dissulfurispiraceae bacterium]